jgi:hypothetical protein
MEQAKVDKVKEWKAPTNVKEVCKFLGFTGYYCYFIQDYSKYARPLIELTRKETVWQWKEKEQQAFEFLQDKMCSKPVLQQPDFTCKFFVHTDALSYGAGAILSQESTDQTTKKPKQHPIAYYSTTFTPME